MLVVSLLARVEVPSAIRRKQRVGDLTEEDADALIADFEADWYQDDDASRFVVIDLTADLVEVAADLTGDYALKAYDAIQLASAIEARDTDDDIDTFACYDASLRRAAQAEDFDLLD